MIAARYRKRAKTEIACKFSVYKCHERPLADQILFYLHAFVKALRYFPTVPDISQSPTKILGSYQCHAEGTHRKIIRS
ncbi:hypothetical protein L596_010543 [Steinernema carpocapsae]|uniref:Uncharacterized protein n=1 Tax=Steinernema carpocapsae TaxID=34508 RepID=A0A4U5PJD2_STECR|nr:hypothetical protein L596_010543 [Steinernema carpocapsae]